MKTSDEQIAELHETVWIRLGCSSIHGIGCIAIRDIPKGTQIYADNAPQVYNLPHEMLKSVLPEIQEIVLERYPLVEYGCNFTLPDARMLAYMNHSDDPNYNSEDDTVLRDIKKGEEITENYRTIEHHEKMYPWLI